MVDTTPWTSLPEQMILGSFLSDWDNSKDSTHKNNDADLNHLFKSYVNNT
jgi:hypothetical protein